MVRSKTWIGYLAILAVGLGLTGAVGAYWTHEYGAVREHYIANSAAKTRFVADKVESAFSEIYQNIRTLSLLPALKTVDRNGTYLSPEAKITIQQIYNNLASNADVSEVYFLPVNFDPEKIDPGTGHHEAPILAFDQLIAPNSSADASGAAADAAVTTASSADRDFVGYPDVAGLPQVEIFEYRQLKKQLAWLSTNFPKDNMIKGMDVPMVGSPELITCDNSDFDKTKNDADRMGLIQMVPYYGADGRLKGGVAAIMRSNAYRALLPDTDYALVNAAYDFTTRPKAGGQEGTSAPWVKQGKPDSSLIYSETVPVATPDSTSNWVVWSGHPNALFEGSSEAVSVRYSAIGSFAAIGVLMLAALGVWFLIGRNMQAAIAAGALLEGRVAERTAEIQSLATSAEASSAHSLARVAETNRLNENLSEVVSRAVDGDFAGRVSITLTDPGLNALAQSVNNLVETVDRGISETGRVLSALAQTDLTQRVTGQYAGAMADLKDDTNSVADRLTEVVLQLRSASGAVRTATAEILSGTNDLAERTTQQAASLKETSAAIDRLDDTTAGIAQRAGAARDKAAAVAETAARTGDIMTKANDAMDRISASSSKISNIISLIDDIAFQTNLLALNASVEAARAGDAGNGFAVVAVEVRRLAQSAAGASSQVKALVEQAATEVAGGNKLVAEATRSLGSMLSGIHENSDLVAGIAAATKEQSTTISEISNAVRHVDEMTQHNAALVQQTNVTIEQTEGQANELDRLVDIFVVDDAGHAPAVATPTKPGPAHAARRAA